MEASMAIPCRALTILWLSLLGGCRHTSVYRIGANDAERVARAICREVGGGGNDELPNQRLRCVILHGLKFELEYSANKIAVMSPDEWVQNEVALALGRVAGRENIEVVMDALQ
jgi:hypothetical protein